MPTTEYRIVPMLDTGFNWHFLQFKHDETITRRRWRFFGPKIRFTRSSWRFVPKLKPIHGYYLDAASCPTYLTSLYIRELMWEVYCARYELEKFTRDYPNIEEYFVERRHKYRKWVDETDERQVFLKKMDEDRAIEKQKELEDTRIVYLPRTEI